MKTPKTQCRWTAETNKTPIRHAMKPSAWWRQTCNIVVEQRANQTGKKHKSLAASVVDNVNFGFPFRQPYCSSGCILIPTWFWGFRSLAPRFAKPISSKTERLQIRFESRGFISLVLVSHHCIGIPTILVSQSSPSSDSAAAASAAAVGIVIVVAVAVAAVVVACCRSRSLHARKLNGVHGHIFQQVQSTNVDAFGRHGD